MSNTFVFSEKLFFIHRKDIWDTLLAQLTILY